MIKTFSIYLLIFVLSGLCPASFPQTQPWKKQQSPVNATLKNLVFVDSLTGWAAGDYGAIIHTTDGGNNWEVQNSTVQTFILDIFFINKDIGWALTLKDIFPFNSVILKTTNGGNDWVAENFQDPNALIRTIFFFDSLNGFVGGSYIAHTSDGGNSWIKAEVDSNMVSNFPVYQFDFYSRQFGYACGGRIDIAGVVWRTTNYGLNWTAQGISPDEIFDIFIFDSLNAITLSGDPEGFFGIAKLKTTNAGLSWDFEELLFYGLSFTIDFRTLNEGWSASGYKFLYTSDRGEAWQEFETPDSSVIYDLQFVDARIGYAVGENGVILKLDPTLVSVKSNTSTPTEFALEQNYPNPFNPTTKIKFTIPTSPQSPPYQGGEAKQGWLVQLNVYDILGNKVATLVDEEKPAGIYEVEFSALGESSSGGNLASGIYFYQLRAGELVQTKKMVYLK